MLEKWLVMAAVCSSISSNGRWLKLSVSGLSEPTQRQMETVYVSKYKWIQPYIAHCHLPPQILSGDPINRPQQQLLTWPTTNTQALKPSKTCAVCYFGVSLLSGWHAPWKNSSKRTMPIVTLTYHTTFSAAVAFSVWCFSSQDKAMLLHCHSKKWQSSSDDSLKKYSFYQSDIRKTQKPQQKNHDVSVTCVFFLRQLIVYDSAIL